MLPFGSTAVHLPCVALRWAFLGCIPSHFRVKTEAVPLLGLLAAALVDVGGVQFSFT